MRETAARQSPPSKGAASSIGPAKTSKRSSAQDRIWRMVALSARDIGVQRACGCNGGAGREDELMGRYTTIQPSLTVSIPGDPFELEADRVADQVMRMPASTAESRQISRLQISRFADNRSLHRSCTTCAAADGDPAVATAEGLSGGGEMLDDGTRTFMEERFAHDFSDVRVHTESQAADSARS